ncbi:MAG: hypothetical protein RMK84_04920 [Oscillochloridaceae bacterium]|nr:hypothetical protein [Chloroflexaceae bacterium]MDW8389445.1 hypothetical protein [Oscillochloridaceae bacterium]
MRGRSVRTAERAGGGEEATRLTRCAGTWLAQPPDAAEQERIAEASRRLQQQRAIATEFYRDLDAAGVFCIELFRGEEFAPLHFSDELVEQMIARVGEPPVVEAGEEHVFSDYLRRAVLSVASPNTRRLLAAQLRRYLPRYVEARRWKEAIAIDFSALRTSLGNEVSPFLAQMALAGLADYYEAREEEG